MRDELNPGCRIIVSIIDQPFVQNEIEAFVDQWRGTVDDVIRRVFHSFQGRVNGIPLPASRPPCRVLWTRFNVHSNGDVSICYNDSTNDDVLGNLLVDSTSIAAFCRHPRYVECRDAHQHRRFPGFCGKCNGWTGASWETPYENLFERLIAKG